MNHPLDNWKSYFTFHDYNCLIIFIENCKNGFPNDKIVLLYGTNNGKLIEEIKNYIGKDNYHDCNLNISAVFQPIKKLFFVIWPSYKESNSENENKNKNKKYTSTIINLLKKYNQSIIIDTDKIRNMDINIRNNSNIIKMLR